MPDTRGSSDEHQHLTHFLRRCRKQVERLREAVLTTAGAGPPSLRRAGIHVCAIFNMIDRIADALGFDVPNVKAFEIGAHLLLKHGYH